MKYKDRTEQQRVNPYDMPPDKADTIYVEDIDNITEEIELTLEQLQEAINITGSLKDKIWAKHRGKNVR
jgi:hypothetical protein